MNYYKIRKVVLNSDVETLIFPNLAEINGDIGWTRKLQINHQDLLQRSSLRVFDIRCN